MSDIDYSMQPLKDSGDDTVAPATFGGTQLPGENDAELVEMERVLIVRTNTVMVPVVPDGASEGTRAGDDVIVAFLEEMRNLGYWVNEELLGRLRFALRKNTAEPVEQTLKQKQIETSGATRRNRR